jgi:hypothetical protein
LNRKVLQEVTPVIDAGDDFLTIMAAEERISLMAEKRKKELETSQGKMKSDSACVRIDTFTLFNPFVLW